MKPKDGWAIHIQEHFSLRWVLNISTTRKMLTSVLGHSLSTLKRKFLIKKLCIECIENYNS